MVNKRRNNLDLFSFVPTIKVSFGFVVSFSFFLFAHFYHFFQKTIFLSVFWLSNVLWNFNQFRTKPKILPLKNKKRINRYIIMYQKGVSLKTDPKKKKVFFNSFFQLQKSANKNWRKIIKPQYDHQS